MNLRGNMAVSLLRQQELKLAMRHRVTRPNGLNAVVRVMAPFCRTHARAMIAAHTSDRPFTDRRLPMHDPSYFRADAFLVCTDLSAVPDIQTSNNKTGNVPPDWISHFE